MDFVFLDLVELSYISLMLLLLSLPPCSPESRQCYWSGLIKKSYPSILMFFIHNKQFIVNILMFLKIQVTSKDWLDCLVIYMANSQLYIKSALAYFLNSRIITKLYHFYKFEHIFHLHFQHVLFSTFSL